MEALLDVRGVSELLRLCESSIYHMVADGTLPHFKINKSVRFRPSELEGWLEEQHSEKDKAAGNSGNAQKIGDSYGDSKIQPIDR